MASIKRDKMRINAIKYWLQKDLWMLYTMYRFISYTSV